MTMEKAKEYLSKLELEYTEESIQRVFVHALEDYLHGEISANLFNTICEQFHEIFHTNDITVKNSELLGVIDEGVELKWYRNNDTSGLSKAEDRFKQFYKNVRKDNLGATDQS